MQAASQHFLFLVIYRVLINWSAKKQLRGRSLKPCPYNTWWWHRCKRAFAGDLVIFAVCVSVLSVC